MNADVRMNWVMQDTSLPITRQCELAQVPRATFYGRRPANLASDEHLLYMRLIDEEYTRHPFYGSRRMVVFLQRGGHEPQTGAASDARHGPGRYGAGSGNQSSTPPAQDLSVPAARFADRADQSGLEH